MGSVSGVSAAVDAAAIRADPSAGAEALNDQGRASRTRSRAKGGVDTATTRAAEVFGQKESKDQYG